MNQHRRRLTVDPAKAERCEERAKKREARVRLRAQQKQYIAHPLADIMRPNWSSLVDHKILVLKSEGEHFHAIAKRLKRTAREIEQRFHRLRAIRDIKKKLETYGVNRKPYPECPE